LCYIGGHHLGLRNLAVKFTVALSLIDFQKEKIIVLANASDRLRLREILESFRRF